MYMYMYNILIYIYIVHGICAIVFYLCDEDEESKSCDGEGEVVVRCQHIPTPFSRPPFSAPLFLPTIPWLTREYLVFVAAKENVLMDAKEIVSVEAKRNVVLWGQGKIYWLFLTKIKTSSLNCSIFFFICQKVSGFKKISFHKISADF